MGADDEVSEGTKGFGKGGVEDEAAADASSRFPPSTEERLLSSESTLEPPESNSLEPSPKPPKPPNPDTAPVTASVTATSADGSFSSWDPSVNPNLDPTGRWNFHSLNRVKAFEAADLEAPEELRAAAAARSFRSEIILIVANGAVADMVANFALNLAALKMAHYLVVTDQPSGCADISKAAGGVAGGACGWTSYMSAQLGGGRWCRLMTSVDSCRPTRGACGKKEREEKCSFEKQYKMTPLAR